MMWLTNVVIFVQSSMQFPFHNSDHLSVYPNDLHQTQTHFNALTVQKPHISAKCSSKESCCFRYSHLCLLLLSSGWPGEWRVRQLWTEMPYFSSDSAAWHRWSEDQFHSGVLLIVFIDEKTCTAWKHCGHDVQLHPVQNNYITINRTHIAQLFGALKHFLKLNKGFSSLWTCGDINCWWLLSNSQNMSLILLTLVIHL